MNLIHELLVNLGMQSYQATQLRKNWGDKPCNHPNIEKEYYLGSATGDKVCSRCGKIFYPETSAGSPSQKSNKLKLS